MSDRINPTDEECSKKYREHYINKHVIPGRPQIFHSFHISHVCCCKDCPDISNCDKLRNYLIDRNHIRMIDEQFGSIHCCTGCGTSITIDINEVLTQDSIDKIINKNRWRIRGSSKNFFQCQRCTLEFEIEKKKKAIASHERGIARKSKELEELQSDLSKLQDEKSTLPIVCNICLKVHPTENSKTLQVYPIKSIFKFNTLSNEALVKTVERVGILENHEPPYIPEDTDTLWIVHPVHGFVCSVCRVAQEGPEEYKFINECIHKPMNEGENNGSS